MGLVLEGGQAPAAVRAVVQVLLHELLERAAAQPQVLDRVGQVAGRRRQRGRACRRPRTARRSPCPRRWCPGSTSRMTSRSERARRRYFCRWLTCGNLPTAMRVLIFHGYLLRGTGSNIYNLSLVPGAGGPRPRGAPRLPGARRRRRWTCPTAVHVHNPDIGRVLPVYVADEYEGFDAVPFPELDDEALEHYLEANVDAVAEVAERVRARRGAGQPPGDGPGDPGPRAGRPGAVRGQGARQRAGVHGAPAPRALPALRARGARAAPPACWWARATPPRACGRSWTTPSCPARTRLGPPGVDVHEFRPRPPAEAAAAAGRAGRPPGAAPTRRAGAASPGAAEALRELDPARDRIVSYVGKLIVSKGVDLLLAAWPLVVAEVPRGAAVRGRLRHLPRRAWSDRRGAWRAATWTPCARSPPRAASSRAGPRASWPTWRPSSTASRAPARRLPAPPAPEAAERVHLHRPPGARRPARAAARVRGAGGAQHVPGGVRHGGRRGGRLRRAAAVGGALRAGRGHRHARRRARPATCGRCCPSSAGPGAVEEIAAKLIALAHAGAGDPRRGGGGAGRRWRIAASAGRRWPRA